MPKEQPMLFSFTNMPNRTPVNVKVRGFDVGKHFAVTPSFEKHEAWAITHKKTGCSVDSLVTWDDPTEAANIIAELEKLNIPWDELSEKDVMYNKKYIDDTTAEQIGSILHEARVRCWVK